MAEPKKFRIDMFEQLDAFYSIVYNGDIPFTPHHISLYIFLLNQCNRSRWVEWFKCPFDIAMGGSCIGSRKTYYKVLDDLSQWKLIKYEKGVNHWKAPHIHLIQIGKKGQVNVPLSEQVPTPLHILLNTLLPTSLRNTYIKLITENINKLITENYKELLSLDFDFEKFYEKKFYKEKISGGEKIVHPFSSDVWKLTWKNWITYRTKIEKPYLNEISEQAELKQLSEFTEQEAIKMIERSMANGWKGIFELDKKKNNNNDFTREEIERAVAGVTKPQ